MEEKIKITIEKQRDFFSQHATIDVEFRIKQLMTLKKAVQNHEKEILEAINSDLRKPETEAFMAEVFYVYNEIKYVLKNIRKWVKPQKVKTNLMNFPAKSIIYKDPLGVSLIISPWNYPFQLLFVPLVYAIAAGNCVILKPSEVSSATSKVIADIIAEYFNDNYIAAFEGGIEISQALLKEKFDHIFYTGSTPVGRVVMEAAAKHLTPIVLELGGKSPCIVHKDADIGVTARRILWGKLSNSGQTCVAPDYIYVHKEVKEELIEVFKNTITDFYGGNPQNSPDFARIINKKHYDRLIGFIGEDITSFGKPDREDLYIPPTIIEDADWNHKIMEDEIFGPILPILEYSDISEVTENINKQPKPLALYLFTKNKAIQNKILTETSSGGVSINDTVKHITSEHLPFGGVGESGMGSYHGKAGFDAFTHHKSVLKRYFIFDMKALYPPYKFTLDKLKNIIKWM